MLHTEKDINFACSPRFHQLCSHACNTKRTLRSGSKHAQHAQQHREAVCIHSVRRGGALETACRRVSLQMVVAAATAALVGLTPISLAFTTSHDRCCSHTTSCSTYAVAYTTALDCMIVWTISGHYRILQWPLKDFALTQPYTMIWLQGCVQKHSGRTLWSHAYTNIIPKVHNVCLPLACLWQCTAECHTPDA